MLFLFHILLFVHGLAGLAVTKVRTTAVYELLPENIIEFCNRVWPADKGQIYQLYKPDVDELIAEPGRAYAISGAQVLYSLWYLHSKHRTV